MLVSERRIAADSATARAPTVPGRSAPYPYSTGRLVTHVFRQAHALRLRCLRPHRRGPRGVTYDTVLATRRLGGRRRGVARGSPPPHRVVARGSERPSRARQWSWSSCTAWRSPRPTVGSVSPTCRRGATR